MSYTLGLTFMRNFYTELNFADFSMNFAISKLAAKGTDMITSSSTKTFAGLKWYWWALIALGGLLLIVWISVFIWCCVKRCKKEIKESEDDFDSEESGAEM